MKTWLLAALLAVPSAAYAQEEDEPASSAPAESETSAPAQSAITMGGAGLGQGDADTGPTANPTVENSDDCQPLRLPAKYIAREPNGWFPQISPTGRYVAHGFGKVSVIDLVTQSEKVIDERHTFLVGWIKPNVLSYVHSTGNSTADRYEATAPDFTPRKMPDDPGLAAGNQHSAADGHWASYLAGGFRIAYDNKLLATGTGGTLSVSQDWVAHAATNDNAAITVWKGGRRYRQYPAKTPLNELNINRGYIAYGGYGPIHGISPTGQDIDLSVYPKFEGLPRVFFVGKGRSAKPWVASGAYDHKTDKGWTVLRPWGQKAGIVLDENASGMSVLDACGTIVVARNNDKGRLNIITTPDTAPLMSLEDIQALLKKAADTLKGDTLTVWTEPAFGDTGSGVVRLAGTAADSVRRVDILVNLKQVGTARLSAGEWTYQLDTSPYQGGINLSAQATDAAGKIARDTIRFNVAP